MITRRKKTIGKGRPGRPRIVGRTQAIPASSSQPSLPPAVVGAHLESPPPVLHSPEDTRIACPKCGCLTKLPTCPICSRPVPQPLWRLPDDSIIREHAVRIIALRLGGMEDEEIAAYLKISKNSISPYIYRAGKNGWLSFNSARENIDAGLMHKVVRNLDEFLDARDKETTLEVFKGTVSKEYGADHAAGPVQQTAISIRIDTSQPAVPMREGTCGGAPNYLEGETD